MKMDGIKINGANNLIHSTDENIQQQYLTNESENDTRKVCCNFVLPFIL